MAPTRVLRTTMSPGCGLSESWMAGLAMLRMMGGSPASHDHDHIDALASRTD
jgi:hypothetical protein